MLAGLREEDSNSGPHGTRMRRPEYATAKFLLRNIA
jgi:hypothetical protein